MSDHLARLRSLLASPDAANRLAEAALVVAQARRPGLDIAGYLRQFDDWAKYLLEQLDGDRSDAVERILLLNRFLFDELGFAGDGEHFFDPDNFYLDTVLDRRRGIPITLSVVYIELGRRIGLPLHGVCYPGHFLVTLPVSHGAVVLDPYSDGASLEVSDLERYLHHADPERQWDNAGVSALLQPATVEEILVRMLRNLKGIYWKARQLLEGVAIQDMLLAVDGSLAIERRDRGILNQQLGQLPAALKDFSDYLTSEPDALDADLVRARMIELSKRAPLVH